MVHGVRLRGGHLDMDFAPNTHMLNFAARYPATVEGGTLPYELDGDLNTLASYDFQGTPPGGFTAHTTVDPVSCTRWRTAGPIRM
ncbi:hypothetical protein ACWD5Q_32005 [Streptomyces sp. NPDC002513]